MTRTIIVGMILYIIAILIQTTILAKIAFLVVTPDLSLLVLLFVSVRNGSMPGQVVGFLGGLVEDLVSASPLGFHMLKKTIIGFCFGLFHGKLFIDKILFPLIFGALGSLSSVLLNNLLAFLFPGAVNMYDLASKMFWLELVYNTALSPIVFMLLSLFKKSLVVDRDI